jgi:hypothetical protein
MNRLGLAPQSVTSFGREQMRDLPAVRVIPYEYVADFALRGEVGNLVQDVINISVEGVFVAVAIGYGLDEDRAASLTILTGPDREPRDPLDPTKPKTLEKLGEITLDNIPPDALVEGFRINPSFSAAAVQSNGQLNGELPFEVAKAIFQRLQPTDNFGFLLSIVDTATGRELQNKPVHSVATLGRADGRRPFKMLPQPLVFLPRSTIRLQVEERTAQVQGRLFITLQGYKVLGLAGALEEETRRLGAFAPLSKIPIYDHETGNYRTLGEALQQDLPTTKVVPFDYVSTIDLIGKRGNIVEDEVPVNIDGGYVATAISYSLDAGDTRVPVELDHATIPPLNPTDRPTNLVNLKKIRLIDIKPAQALLDGIRLHPLRVRFAFTPEGRLLEVVDKDLAGRMFQSLNRPEEVRFLYSITDSGTGRELQTRRVHSVASLGIANGERPFKVFHKPMTFLPRSTIRVQVEEIFGRGRLFLVFQGYKMLR